MALAPENGAAQTAGDRHSFAGLRVLWAEGHEQLTEVTGSNEPCFDGVCIIPQLGGRLFGPTSPLRISTGRDGCGLAVCARTRRDVTSAKVLTRLLGA